MPTAGTFCHVLIFSRIVLDTLLGVLQAYVVAFCIREVSSESSFWKSACLSPWLFFEVFVVVFLVSSDVWRSVGVELSFSLPLRSFVLCRSLSCALTLVKKKIFLLVFILVPRISGRGITLVFQVPT